MTTTEDIKNEIINKVLAIKDKKLLEALDQIISATTSDKDIIELTTEQKLMLEMSEIDIERGDIISQSEMSKRHLTWLNAM